MSEERQFLAAIRAKPDDRTTRLVYADWLDEHAAAPRAELIRVEEEIRITPIYADRYWELKPRRRALLKKLGKQSWLTKMGYVRTTDYQPVFADVPAGWKERWRLLREFVERWYQIPMDDVGGPLKPLPRRPQWFEDDALTVDAAMNDPEAIARLQRRLGLKVPRGRAAKNALKASDLPPPSVCEWLFFIRDLLLGLKDFSGGSGDRHVYGGPGERLDFLLRDGGREFCFARGKDRRQPDPPVWWDSVASHPGHDYSRLVAPHVTTFALHYLLTQYEPEFGMEPGAQKMTKTFARQLANYFPVRSDFDGTLIFERPNVIALWMPESLFAEDGSLHVKVRPPADPDEVYDQLWG